MTSSAAKNLEQANESEPTMDEILASIRQIIADDETSDDGLSERERYTHPSDHSNSNENADFAEAFENELNAAMNEEMPSSPDAAPVVAAAVAAPTLAEKAQAVREGITAAGDGLSADERLEKYRVRGKSHLEALEETLAARSAAPAPASAIPVQPVSGQQTIVPPVTATPVLPTTGAIADKMAQTMMEEKSAEIEAMLSDLVRPIVRTWLADNLPSLVERLVREEIERVSQGRKPA